MASAVRYAESRAGTINFAVVDESGRLHGYHARTPIYSASMLKPMLLVAYLRMPSVRDRPLRTWERESLTPMIRRSDNANVLRLIGIVGRRRLHELATAAGMGHFVLHMPWWGSSETTPLGQARFFHRIDRLVPSRHRAYAMHLLATIVSPQRWGVGRVPHGRWRLYFKGGWSAGTGFVDHQVALYRMGGERFSLAVFTRFNPDHEYGKGTLRGLASRLLRGIARPQEGLARVRRAAVGGRYFVTAGADCGHVAIRRPDARPRSFATGAPSCAGFRLASGRGRALWAWVDGSGSHLATASYGGDASTELGDFTGPSDELGELAGAGPTLAYLHGDEATIVGGVDCSAPGATTLAVGPDVLATAAGNAIDIRDSFSCAPVRSFDAAGKVEALAVGEGDLAALSQSPRGKVRLECFSVSTGARLGRRRVPVRTLHELATSGGWILYRTLHALRALSAPSGRSWTIWRPVRAPVAAGLSGRRVLWIENDGDRAERWSLRLPRT
jgi:hypothetical protein